MDDESLNTTLLEIAAKMEEAERFEESSIEAPLEKVQRLVDAGLVQWRITPSPAMSGGERTDFSNIESTGNWYHSLAFTEQGKKRLAGVRQ